jgi:hypothetical protein
MAGLGGVALAGAGLVLTSTRHGVSLGSDSAAYFAAARNLVAGHGLSWLSGGGEARPLVLHAPLYPLALAAFELLSVDLAVAARGLNAMALGMSALVLGLLIHRLTDRWLFAVLGSAILVVSGEFLQIHVWAMSDPIYISLSLLAMLLAALYLADRRRPELAALAAVASAAYLARYAGLALVASIVLAVAVVPGAIRARRWLDAAIVLAVGLIPMGLWFARNARLTGQFAGRTLGWSSADPRAAIDQTAAVILNWFLPTRLVDRLQGLYPILTVVAVAALIGGLVLLGLAIRRWSGAEHSSRVALLVVLGVYLVAYLGMMAMSVLFSRPGTDLNVRTLSPVYPVLLALIAAGLAALWSLHVLWIRLLVVGLSVAFLGAKAFDAYRLVDTRLGEPLGYASRAWQTSPTMAALVELSPDLVYTDDIAAVYLLANPRVMLVPLQADSATGESRSNYDMDLQTMRRRIERGEALLALFHPEAWPPELAPYDELTSGLAPIGSFEDGLIFGPLAEASGE